MAARLSGSADGELQVVFVFGSPRSGTTLLEEILGSHPAVGHFYEPYYVWYRAAGATADDYLPPEAFGPRALAWVRRQFDSFAAGVGKKIIVDKSPEHAFNLPVLLAAFPTAKFVHILRDGRDVTLSIKKEWAKREQIVRQRSWRALWQTARAMLARQPLWRFRLLAVWHELRGRITTPPHRWLNKAKWRGEVGWGPRFRGWQNVRAEQPLIGFNAHQWLCSVEQIEADLPKLPSRNVFELRYEDLIAAERPAVLEDLFSFLGLDAASALERAPRVRTTNTGKWATELDGSEIDTIGPILHEKLCELGYVSDASWYAGRS